jgi:hypothetical protein
VVAARARRARAGGRIRGPERRVGARLHLLPPSSGEAPSSAGGGPSPSRLALEPRPWRAAGDGAGVLAPVTAVVQRWRGAVAMASTRAGCSASSTAGGAPLPRAPPRQPLYLSSPLATAGHPRRLLPRLARTCKKARRTTPLPVSSTSIASLFGSSVVFWVIGACNCSHEAGSIRV